MKKDAQKKRTANLQRMCILKNRVCTVFLCCPYLLIVTNRNNIKVESITTLYKVFT